MSSEDDRDLESFLLELIDVITELAPATADAARTVADKAKSLKERLQAARRMRASSSSEMRRRSPSSERSPPSSSERGSGSFAGATDGQPLAKSYTFEDVEIERAEGNARALLEKAAARPSQFSEFFLKG